MVRITPHPDSSARPPWDIPTEPIPVQSSHLAHPPPPAQGAPQPGNPLRSARLLFFSGVLVMLVYPYVVPPIVQLAMPDLQATAQLTVLTVAGLLRALVTLALMIAGICRVSSATASARVLASIMVLAEPVASLLVSNLGGYVFSAVDTSSHGLVDVTLTIVQALVGLGLIVGAWNIVRGSGPLTHIFATGALLIIVVGIGRMRWAFLTDESWLAPQPLSILSLLISPVAMTVLFLISSASRRGEERQAQ